MLTCWISSQVQRSSRGPLLPWRTLLRWMAKGWTELAKGIWLSPAGRVMERASPPVTQKRSSTSQPRTRKSAAGTVAGATAASAGDAAPASKETVDELRLTKKVAKAVGASAAVAAAAVSAASAPRARAHPRRACCTAASRRWWLWSVWPMFCAAWLFGLPVKDTFSSLSRGCGRACGGWRQCHGACRPRDRSRSRYYGRSGRRAVTGHRPHRRGNASCSGTSHGN